MAGWTLEQDVMKIYIHGGEIVTAQGNLKNTWQALLQTTLPKTYTPQGHRQAVPLSLISELNQQFGSKDRLEELLEKVYHSLPPLSPDTSLVCATTKGAIDEVLVNSSPTRGQLWQIAAEIQNRLQLDQDADCISAACASGTIAIIQSAQKIALGECNTALIIGIDLMSNFVLNGFISLKALSQTGCRPFDKKRDGLTLGEGAGWLLLSRDPGQFSNTAKKFLLAGWGMSCDATHITAPCRNGSGLIRSIKQTLSTDEETPGGINAHGTGTYYNDAMELLAFQNIWQKLPPICSVKGTIGHCLGAAGVIESCLSLKSLDTGYLPPTAGLKEAEDNAGTSISGIHPLKLQNSSILTCNSGFGGINAAILFKEEN